MALRPRPCLAGQDRPQPRDPRPQRHVHLQRLPSTSYGSNESLFCGDVSSAYGNCKTLVRFPAIDNTNNISADAHISSATFSIRQFWQPANAHDRTHVYRVGTSSTNWGEGTTWNSVTLSGSEKVNPNGFSPTGNAWLNVACTGITQDWGAGYPPNKGFCIRQLDADGASYARKFRSGEYGVVVEWRPNMSVDWELPQVSISGAQSVYHIGDTMTVQA